MRIGVLANVYRPGIEAAFAQLCEWARKDDHDVCYESGLSGYCAEGTELRAPSEIPERTDMVLAFGGDGTMLRAARIVGERGIPILGVNLGSLGFLTQVTPAEFAHVLPRLSRGDYLTEPRSVLAMNRTGDSDRHAAFNEVAVDRGQESRAIEIKLEADGRLVSRYVADGVIVATPTGSTAYALSAGGPVAVPGVQALVATPVAAHSLAQRPIVFPDDVVLRITSEEPNVQAAVMLDGQPSISLGYGESCEVRRADFNLQIVRLAEQDFYSLVRTKLHWGVDPRHAHRDGHVV